VPVAKGTQLSPRQVTLVGLMFGFSILNYFDRTIMSIAGPEVMREFALSPTQMGSVYSAFVLSYAVCMIPGGRLVDRLGGRLSLTLVGGFAALFTALTAVGGTPLAGAVAAFPVLLVIRLGLGLASAPIYTACARMCANWIHPARQASVQGIIIAGSAIGGALSPITFSWLILQLRWRASFCVAAAITAGLALVWHMFAREHPVGTGQRSLEAPAGIRSAPWRRLFSNRGLMLYTFAYFTVGYFDYIFYYWVYYYFGTVRHMGFAQSARYTTILFLTMAVMMPLGGWTADRLAGTLGRAAGRQYTALAGMLAAALLLVAGTWVTEDRISVALLSVAIGFAAFCEGPFWAAATELGREHVGAACAILNTGSNAGGFFGPLVTPWIAKWFGWSWGMYSASVLVLAGATACYLARPARSPRLVQNVATLQMGPG
jgi:MFS family permease